MTRLLLSIACLLAPAMTASAQADTRPVVGVAQFTCDEESPYTGLVTEKVVEMLTNTKRFRVVDRTSNDKIKAELELQKSEAFIDSKNLVEQDVAVAAEKMITGHIVKIPVYCMRNGDKSIRGYKASVAFQMKIVDVATGLSTEATSFQGKASKENLSPESAVTQAMMSLQDYIYEYFRQNFHVTGQIKRILDSKNGEARMVLINIGTDQGVKAGDTFNVETVEMLDGKPYPNFIGTAKVEHVAGGSFSECKLDKDAAKVVGEIFKTAKEIRCTLIIKNNMP